MNSLSLIIPTYNESKNIVPLIQRVTHVLEGVINNFEIIIVDDDSPDETWKVAEKLREKNEHLKVIRRRNERGLATAVVTGWEKAAGEILGVMDGDLQHPPEILGKLLNAMLHTHADIVVASRYMPEGSILKWNFIRKAFSLVATLIATLLLPGILRTVRDPMSGFFLVRRSVIGPKILKPKGYKILLEVLAKGEYRTLVEIPYLFNERINGDSKLGLRQVLDFLIHLGLLSWETGQIIRFLRYCIVGFSGIFVNEGALTFFTEVSNLYYVYSSCLAVELAIISNFILNDFFTFRDISNYQPGLSRRLMRFVKFNLICAIGAILNVVTLWALTDLARVHYLLSNLVGIGISTLWNYGLNSNITWRPAINLTMRKANSRLKNHL